MRFFLEFHFNSLHLDEYQTHERYIHILSLVVAFQSRRVVNNVYVIKIKMYMERQVVYDLPFLFAISARSNCIINFKNPSYE
jgi:hypothetical protein